MSEPNLSNDLSVQFNARLTWAVVCLLDAAFLVLWLIVQWVINRAYFWFPINGLDEWVFRLAQILFAISTLVPIILFIYKDIRIMFIRVQKNIDREKETSGERADK